MDFDTFVNQPQIIDIKIQHQLQIIERQRSRVESVTAVFNEIRVQTSQENTREIWLTQYVDSKQKLTDLMEEYDRAVEDIRNWLYDNLSTDAASLLEFRYCDGLKNLEIAELLHMAEQSIKNKMSRSVREARTKYNTQKGEK